METVRWVRGKVYFREWIQTDGWGISWLLGDSGIGRGINQKETHQYIQQDPKENSTNKWNLHAVIVTNLSLTCSSQKYSFKKSFPLSLHVTLFH